MILYDGSEKCTRFDPVRPVSLKRSTSESMPLKNISTKDTDSITPQNSLRVITFMPIGSNE
jgi:hypothetical protein